MKKKPSLLAVLCTAAVLATGCARGPGPIKDSGKGVAPDSDFCKAIKEFRVTSGGLNSTLASDPKAASAQAAKAQSDLQAIQATLSGEPVSAVGFKVADDLKAVANAFGAASTALATVPSGDAKRYSEAVNGANSPAVDQASVRLDGYTSRQCGINTRGLPAGAQATPAPSSPAPTTVTTGGPVQGPTGPSSTSANATTSSTTR